MLKNPASKTPFGVESKKSPTVRYESFDSLVEEVVVEEDESGNKHRAEVETRRRRIVAMGFWKFTVLLITGSECNGENVF